MFAAIVNYSFMQNAFIVSIILGIILPIIGIIILLRRIPFIADALGHISMSAVAFSYLLNSILALSFLSSTILIILWTILGGILIEYMSHKYTNYKDVSVMIVYSIAIALTMIFLNLSSGFQSSLYNILFGNINTVSKEEIILIAVVSLIIIFLIGINYKKILIISFDKELSKLYGVNLTFQRYLVIILISLTVTISIKILGVLLVSSLILIPNLAAIKSTKNLKTTVILAIIFTEISFLLGLILSYSLDLSASALIVLVAVCIYILSLIISRKKN